MQILNLGYHYSEILCIGAHESNFIIRCRTILMTIIPLVRIIGIACKGQHGRIRLKAI